MIPRPKPGIPRSNPGDLDGLDTPLSSRKFSIPTKPYLSDQDEPLDDQNVFLYREDFYVGKNIMGYTGELHNFPTVYFKKESGIGMIVTGHITQWHTKADNIGRGLVCTTFHYITESRINPETGIIVLYESISCPRFRKGEIVEQNKAVLRGGITIVALISFVEPTITMKLSF